MVYLVAESNLNDSRVLVYSKTLQSGNRFGPPRGHDVNMDAAMKMYKADQVKIGMQLKK